MDGQTILGLLGFTIIVASAVVAHFRSINILKDKIHAMELDIEKLKGRDDLQELVLEQLGKQNDMLIPQLLDAIKNKGNESK